MKIIRIHTDYAELGGEDISFETEVRLLRQYNQNVTVLLRRNVIAPEKKKIETLIQILKSTYCGDAELEAMLKVGAPQIMHVDNYWYMLTSNVHAIAKKYDVLTIQNLRNYRVLCINGLFLRRGVIWAKENNYENNSHPH